jgi:hypothetical protein
LYNANNLKGAAQSGECHVLAFLKAAHPKNYIVRIL